MDRAIDPPGNAERLNDALLVYEPGTRITQMNSHTASSGMDYLAFGSGGPAVVLLHPLASSGELWRPFAAWLEERNCRVLAPTLPGHTSNAAALTIRSIAAEVAALIVELGLGKASVLGMSMGGCVSLELALRYPQLVDRLVAVDTTSCYGQDRVRQWEKRALMAEESARNDLLPFQLDRWFSEDFRRRDPSEVERIAGIFVRCAKETHAACCRALGGFDVTEQLREIHHPALVLVGEDDYATPITMSQIIADNIPRSKMQVLPGVRHMSIVEAPESWNEILSFVQPAATTSASHVRTGNRPA
jgi:3-oxoadipate enol-lactonase